MNNLGIELIKIYIKFLFYVIRLYILKILVLRNMNKIL